MKDLVAVLTCPRSKSYLDDTLASLERAGVLQADAEKAIVFDGCVPFERQGWNSIQLSPAPSGNLRAFLLMLKLAQDKNVDRLLFFEDDIVACRNSIAHMLTTSVPDDCSFVSFFDMKEIPYGYPAGRYKVSTMGKDGRGYWGSQALLWPRRTIDYLLAHEQEITDGSNLHSSDCLFGRQLLYSPWPQYAVHVPNLVDHVGVISAIWSWIPKVNRQATSFPGENFDAASLPVFTS